MTKTETKPAPAAKEKAPLWRVNFQPEYGEEFSEKYLTEEEALLRVRTVLADGYAAEPGEDPDGTRWVRFHPVTRLREIDVVMKKG